MINIFIASTIILLGSVGGQPDDIEHRSVISMGGKWLVSWQVVKDDFDRIKKKSVECYMITAEEHNGQLIVLFKAVSDKNPGRYLGQGPACGPSVTYNVDRAGKIVSRELDM